MIGLQSMFSLEPTFFLGFGFGIDLNPFIFGQNPSAF